MLGWISRIEARLLLRLAVAALLIPVGGCVSVDLFGGGPSAPLQESVVRGTDGPKILLVDIDGVIGADTPSYNILGREEISMIARVREVLDRARQDEEVKGLLLRIDSPGGTVTASDQIYTEILQFKREQDVPVVAQLLGTAASGGYYVAMSADQVQAHTTTVTGSIGVLFSSVNFVGLMEKLGIEDQTLTAGEFKDAGSPFRRLNAVERAQLQSIVDDLHARFRAVVEAGRPDLSSEDVARLANGQIFSSSQALENGLVDRVGTLEEAVVWLEGQMGVGRSRVVAYHRPSEVRRNLYMRGAMNPPVQFGVMDRLSRLGLESVLSRPGFHYLWWPGLGD